MLPRLQAEEALLERSLMLSVSGYQMRKGDADKFVRRLERTARVSGASGRRVRSVDDLRGMGIQIVDERKKVVNPDS